MAKKAERALTMLNKALDMERKGMAFYEDAIKTCSNQVGKEIFQMLKEEERVHMDRIMKIYAHLEQNEDWTSEWKVIKPDHGDLEEFFTELAKRHGTDITADTSDIEALDVGLDFEQNAVAFYREHLSDAVETLEREFIEEMVAEERSHYKILGDMKLYLTDPEIWFREQEHGGLDGA
ncbi:MAG: ferritin family protein [Deltaproteobacteria bacterium]|nr:ferritin family protein [Candidatus Zymogenaceae bacterium]